MKPLYPRSGAPFPATALVVALMACGQAEPAPGGLACPDGTTAVGRVGEGTWCEKAQSIKHGPYRLWRPNGTIAMEGTYREGLETGDWKFYWDSGAILETGVFRDGKKVGLWRSFRREGGLDSETPYDAEGRVHGVQRALSPDGSLYRASCHRHGQQVWQVLMPKAPLPTCPEDAAGSGGGSRPPSR
ncbi:MAG TPA: hypothetical protein VKB80_13465 [Kofleriaceae bacterium]|nr:hypothetical protein [Kofleriaceae bacterium]